MKQKLFLKKKSLEMYKKGYLRKGDLLNLIVNDISGIDGVHLIFHIIIDFSNLIFQ